MLLGCCFEFVSVNVFLTIHIQIIFLVKKSSCANHERSLKCVEDRKRKNRIWLFEKSKKACTNLEKRSSKYGARFESIKTKHNSVGCRQILRPYSHKITLLSVSLEYFLCLQVTYLFVGSLCLFACTGSSIERFSSHFQEGSTSGYRVKVVLCNLSTLVRNELCILLVRFNL